MVHVPRAGQSTEVDVVDAMIEQLVSAHEPGTGRLTTVRFWVPLSVRAGAGESPS